MLGKASTAPAWRSCFWHWECSVRSIVQLSTTGQCDCLVQHLSSSIQALRTFWGVLRNSSIPTGQGSEWACAHFPDLIAMQPGHPSVVPKASMSVLGILCLRTRAPMNSQSTCHQQFSTFSLDSDHIVDCVFVPPVLLLTSRALNTPFAVPTKHSELLFLTPSHTPNLFLGFYTGIWQKSQESLSLLHGT